MDGINFNGLDYNQCNTLINEIKRSNDIKAREVALAENRLELETLATIFQLSQAVDAPRLELFKKVMGPVLAKYNIAGSDLDLN